MIEEVYLVILDMIMRLSMVKSGFPFLLANWLNAD